MKKETILIFLSRPNPFLESQDKFLSKLKKLFLKYDIETITLRADNYDLTDSINYLRGMIKTMLRNGNYWFQTNIYRSRSEEKGSSR